MTLTTTTVQTISRPITKMPNLSAKTPSQSDISTRQSTRALEPIMQQSKAELIRLSQSTIKNKDAGLCWLTKNGLIIPGETTTIATLTMALLYVSNGKYELKE